MTSSGLMQGLQPLNLAVLREHRAKGLWCCAHSEGPYGLIAVGDDGKEILVRCSFAPETQIDFMVSYRWRHMVTFPENGSKIAVNFLNIIGGRGACWVDSLNHLNDAHLKGLVLEKMGGLYRRIKTIAEYFEYPPPKTIRDVFKMLAEATRGWMWQEVALGPGVEKFASPTAALCFEVLKLGRDRYAEAKTLRDRKDIRNNKERLCFECIGAMVDALEQCADWGPRIGEYVDSKDDAFWSDRRQIEREQLSYDSLLKVPPEAAGVVAELSARRSDKERALMSAAGNMANRNIGDNRTMSKPDLVDASLGVLSSGPEYAAAGDKHARESMVLAEIRDLLLYNCSAKAELVTFHPVPCGDGRVADLFGSKIDAFRFVAQPTDERGGDDFIGAGQVQLRRAGAYSEEVHPCEIWEYHGAPMALGVGREYEVASIHYSLVVSLTLKTVDVTIVLLVSQAGFCLSFTGKDKPKLQLDRPPESAPLPFSPSPDDPAPRRVTEPPGQTEPPRVDDSCSCCVL